MSRRAQGRHLRHRRASRSRWWPSSSSATRASSGSPRSSTARPSTTSRVSSRARPCAWAASTSAQVTGVGHGGDPNDPRIFVSMSIDEEGGRAHPRRHDGAHRQQGPARRQDDRARASARPNRRSLDPSAAHPVRGAGRHVRARPTGSPRRPRRRSRSSSRWPSRSATRSSPRTSRARPRTCTRCSTPSCTATARCTASSTTTARPTSSTQLLANLDAHDRRASTTTLADVQDVTEHVRQGPGHRARARLRRRDLEGHGRHAARAAQGPRGHPRGQRPRARRCSTATIRRST